MAEEPRLSIERETEIEERDYFTHARTCGCPSCTSARTQQNTWNVVFGFLGLLAVVTIIAIVTLLVKK